MNCHLCGVAFDDISPFARFIETASNKPVCLGCNFKPIGEGQDMTEFRQFVNRVAAPTKKTGG